MIRYLLGFTLIVVIACGAQVAPKQPAQPPSSKPSTTPAVPDTAAAVAATAPVITVKGVCTDGTPSSSQTCTTTVTKGQFEKLLNALNSSNQTIAPAMRRNLAHAYLELLAYVQAAEN